MATLPTLDKDTVYWIEDPAGHFLPEIAGDVEYRDSPGELCYFDTQRAHMVRASFTGGDDVNGLRFDGEGARKLTLRKLDRVTFDKVFRSSAPDAPRFATDAELQAFYRGVIRAS